MLIEVQPPVGARKPTAKVGGPRACDRHRDEDRARGRRGHPGGHIGRGIPDDVDHIRGFIEVIVDEITKSRFDHLSNAFVLHPAKFAETL